MKYLLAATLVVAIVLYGLRLVNAGEFVPNCPKTEYDHNWDCQHNPADAGMQASYTGLVVLPDGSLATRTPLATWTPSATFTPTLTYTPTSVATPASTMTPSPSSSATPTLTPTSTTTATPSPSATSTATRTPTPSSYTVADLLNDSTGLHAGDICGIGGYDWENRGVVQRQAPGSDRIATGWFVANWNCGSNVAGVRYQVRNVTLYALTTPGWQVVGSGIGWCAELNPPTNIIYGGCDTSGDWAMPNSNRSIHGATSRVSIPSSTQCLVTTGEQRITGSGYVIGNFGADYISAGGGIGGAVVGRFRRLTNDWQFYGASSCPASAFQSNPPPGVSHSN